MCYSPESLKKVLQLPMLFKKYYMRQTQAKQNMNKGSEFYNRSMKSLLEKNDIKIY